MVLTIDDVREWARAIAALDATGPLPSRVAIVPSEAHAHALRVALVDVAPPALVGTRFCTVTTAARAVLDHAGVVHHPGEEDLRPFRIRRLIRERRFGAIDSSAGWNEAIAASIGILESSGITADAIEVGTIDLAELWRALDEDAGASWTVPRIVREASRVLGASPRAWPFCGPTLAMIDPCAAPVEAAFVVAIPGVQLAAPVARPLRRRLVDRVRALYGECVAGAIAHQTHAVSGGEIDVLHAFLFESPERLAGDRPRSRGPDGTVSLEAHSGVTDEVDAAVYWAASEIDRGTPAREIAILVPDPDPLAPLVADRLAALPWPGEPPVYLACGRPATTTAAGARVLAILDVLAGYLPVEGMTALLPRLRTTDPPLSPSRARRLVQQLGVAGGSRGRPRDVLRWGSRIAAVDTDDGRASRPAIESLVEIVARAIDEAPFQPLWRMVRAFLDTHVASTHHAPTVIASLEADVIGLADAGVVDDVCGVGAIEMFADRLRRIRLRAGRFGDPAIYVGAIADAAGLPFTAVRIVGLAEGRFPGTVREDPLLPATRRARMPAFSVPLDEDRAVERLVALHRVVRGTAARIAFSMSRTDVSGSEREPAALVVEAAAALARPDAISGAIPAAIPDRADLERDYYGPARHATRASRVARPLTASCWLDRAALRATDLPLAWTCTRVVDPIAILSNPEDVDLAIDPSTANVPGLRPDRPIAATSLRTLLVCPHRFFLQHVLDWWPPDSPAERHRIDPSAYGRLLHRVAELFSREHGVAFGRRDGSLARWLAIVGELARRELDTFLDSYPLAEIGAIESERSRFERDVAFWIEHDWNDGIPRAFVAAERSFGDGGIELDTETGSLFVAGRIDRVDIDGDVTLVRDLKTGRVRPRDRDDEAPRPELDLQLAIYVRVVEQLAAAWSVPPAVAAAYVHVDPLAVDRERSFRDDPIALRDAGRRWLDLAGRLLREGRFVRTPIQRDCERCPFEPACGRGAAAVSREQLAAATGTLALYREIKT